MAAKEPLSNFCVVDRVNRRAVFMYLHLPIVITCRRETDPDVRDFWRNSVEGWVAYAITEQHGKKASEVSVAYGNLTFVWLDTV
jgi:hypothetical protein